MNLTFVKGDVTNPGLNRNTIIVHCCNDRGVMGAGVALALRKKWPQVYSDYTSWFDCGRTPTHMSWQSSKVPHLGEIQVVDIDPQHSGLDGNISKYYLGVCNIIGQRDTQPNSDGLSPVRYFAITSGLAKLGRFIKSLGKSKSIMGVGRTTHIKDVVIVMPRIGCGLAMATWDKIQQCIEIGLEDVDIEVIVYDFGG